MAVPRKQATSDETQTKLVYLQHYGKEHQQCPMRVTRAKLVPWRTEIDPDGLCGMALVPIDCDPKILDAELLAERLRDITPEFPPDPVEQRARAVELRDTLIAEGGLPTRPVKTMSAAQGNPETIALYDTDVALYELYLDEWDYWLKELQSWREFVKYCVQKNLTGLSQVQQFVEYVAFQQKKIRKFKQIREIRERLEGFQHYLLVDEKALMDRLASIQGQLAVLQATNNIHTETPRRRTRSQHVVNSKRMVGECLRRSSRLAAKATKLCHHEPTVTKPDHEGDKPISTSKRLTAKGDLARTNRSRRSVRGVPDKPQGIVKSRK